MKNIVIKILVLFFFFSVSISFQLKAEEVQLTDIKKVALNAFFHFSGTALTELDILQITPIEISDTTLFYVLDFTESFIIISADDIAEPVIGYGLNSSLDFNDIPPALHFLLEGYKEEILNAKKLRTGATQEISDQWEFYLNYDPEKKGNQPIIIAERENLLFCSYVPGTYLIETKWAQSGGSGNGSTTYNYYCPSIGQTKTLVGCGGVAVAQILNYWKCRVHPQDPVNYLPPGLDSIKINMAAQTYNWFNMLPHQANVDNAKLLYHSAAAIQSEFGTSNTDSYSFNTLSGFKNNFGFSAVMYIKDAYSGNWIDLLKTNINNCRPVFYRGTDTLRGAHAWVVDGYNSSNHFHCNWGWGGSSDGWFNLSNLTGNVAFATDQAAIANIYPTYYSGITTFQNIAFNSNTYTGHTVRVLNCTVQNNANVIFEVGCTMEVNGPFEVPIGATLEVR